MMGDLIYQNQLEITFINWSFDISNCLSLSIWYGIMTVGSTSSSKNYTFVCNASSQSFLSNFLTQPTFQPLVSMSSFGVSFYISLCVLSVFKQSYKFYYHLIQLLLHNQYFVGFALLLISCDNGSMSIYSIWTVFLPSIWLSNKCWLDVFI